MQLLKYMHHLSHSGWKSVEPLTMSLVDLHKCQTTQLISRGVSNRWTGIWNGTMEWKRNGTVNIHSYS